MFKKIQLREQKRATTQPTVQGLNTVRSNFFAAKIESTIFAILQAATIDHNTT